MQLQDKTALITGGASGIGKLMGRLFLERGARLVIWDIDQNKIENTLAEFKSLGTVHSYRVDVSSTVEINKAAQQVKKEVGTIDILINNAGIVVGKYFSEHSGTDILKTMEINALAPMYVTNEFLPAMLEQNSGHICNIASAAGTISNPKMSVYAASKWSVVGWSDSLRVEMKQQKKNVGVTTIMPYYINTGMFDGVHSKLPILKPERAAKTILRAIEKNKKLITIPGYMYRVTRLGQAIMPLGVFDWFAGDFLGIYKTMEHFTGHKK
ncbi:MAG TPA: SDR family oxidoreductase [Draconibacterium sp.]|nr:SDR family oxidoreductase [Draconibacterium sp.]